MVVMFTQQSHSSSMEMDTVQIRRENITVTSQAKMLAPPLRIAVHGVYSLQNPTRLLGFSYSSGDNERCFCEFDGGDFSDFVYINPSSSESYIGSGTGPVSGTYLSNVEGEEDYDCYVYPTISHFGEIVMSVL